MKRVITYGTFDLFHYGHMNLLRGARELGDYLIVALSTDEFNLIKGKESVMPYAQRKEILQAIRYVDLVIPEQNWEQKITDIKRYNINTFVMGDDWQGTFDFLGDYCDVIYLPRTQIISSTLLKEAIQNHPQ